MAWFPVFPLESKRGRILTSWPRIWTYLNVDVLDSSYGRENGRLGVNRNPDGGYSNGGSGGEGSHPIK